MRKCLLFCVLLLSALGANAQVTFKTIYGTTLRESPVSIANTDAGGYAIAGIATAFSNSMNFQMVVTSNIGDTLWSREYDSGGDDYLSCMIHTSDGGYMMVGNSAHQTSGFSQDILVIKVDASGIITWEKMYSFAANTGSYVNDVIQTSDGGFALAGWYQGVTSGDGIVLKIDANGVLQWMNSYTSAPGSYSRFTCLAEASNGDLIFSGGSSLGTQRSLELFRTTSSGTAVWCHKFNAFSECEPISISVTSAGDIYVGGTRDLYNFPIVPNGMFVIRFDSMGVVQWGNEYSVPGQYSSALSNIRLSSSGDLYVVGRVELQTLQGIVYSVSSSGNSAGAFNYTDTLAYTYVDVTDGSDGGLAILSEKDFAFGMHDTSSFLLIKTTSSMSAQCGMNSYGIYSTPIAFTDSLKAMQVTTGGINTASSITMQAGLTIIPVCALVGIEEMNSAPQAVVYPQPVQSQFTVELSSELAVKHPEYILFNAQGQIVLRKQMIADTETVSCDDLATGIYFWSVVSDGILFSRGKFIKQ